MDSNREVFIVVIVMIFIFVGGKGKVFIAGFSWSFIGSPKVLRSLFVAESNFGRHDIAEFRRLASSISVNYDLNNFCNARDLTPQAKRRLPFLNGISRYRDCVTFLHLIKIPCIVVR
jgi:hypothetical protein